MRVMQSKISKSLEAIIKRTTTSLQRDNITTSFIDRLVVELLSDEATFCSRLLNDLIGERGINVVIRRVMQGIITNPIVEVTPPAARYEHMCNALRSTLTTKRISTAHVLYYATADAMTATSHELRGYGISNDTILHAIQNIIGEQRDIPTEPTQKRSTIEPNIIIQTIKPTTPKGGDTHHTLASYGENITQRAKDGAIDPVIGRDSEIERIAQILSRRKKRNPILIGEAGVGKSAIVEGLALSITEGRVPQALRNMEIYAIDIARVVAGTKFRGEIEERINAIVEAVDQSDDIILFIDEIHTIVGSGAPQGSLDIANMLKPALARGNMLLIGATTPDEYRQSIERDAALERRFQPVRIAPSTAEDTLYILQKLAPHYAKHHNVCYTQEALEKCITMAARYIPERHFPDKAIDIMDEAGVWCGIETSMHNKQREVLACHVDHVTHLITGVPVADITEHERSRITALRSHLQTMVIGQEHAATTLSDALLRLRAGVTDGNRPWGVFIFAGETGVGKTLMAQELARWMTKDGGGLVRIDMSEYGERHSLSRLIGSPPGYVGYGEGGELTEAVRRNPYSVVLLDEIDKAHPEIFNLMLPIFDEGRAVDTMGRNIDFRNTVIIMTTNLGATSNKEYQRLGFRYDSHAEERSISKHYIDAIRGYLRPELLARVDDIVVFNRLDHSALCAISQRELDTLCDRVATRGLHLIIEDGVAEYIATESQHRSSGARAIRHITMSKIENPLSRLIIDNTTLQSVAVRVEKNNIVVEVQM